MALHTPHGSIAQGAVWGGLIGASGDADQMARAFEPHHPASVIRHSIPEATVEKLNGALGTPETGSPPG